MYKCGVCGTQTEAGVPCNITTVDIRARTYPARPNAGDPGGAGYEIVKEIRVCPPCGRGDL